VKPTVVIDYYFVDHSCGGESTDDTSFEGHVECGVRVVDGRFSIGKMSRNLYQIIY
jgi:hypothetical protein